MTRKVGYLGPPGTFGEQAALRQDPRAELVPLPSHAAVVFAVRDSLVEAGVAPIENSLEGAVSETVDTLVQSETVYISGEIVLPVEQCLIAAPGTQADRLTVIMSHPQALAQCRAYLESQCPNARLDAALSTAAAVEEAVRTPGAGAIGTRRAAELTGGEVLAAGIQDVPHNKTRFVLLERSDCSPTGDDKTSIAFTVAHDRPGTLISVLREFSDRGINLTRIESRPSREDLGIYIFLVDLQGHRKDAAPAEALAAVEAQSYYFRLLGSYPRFREEEG